MNVYWLLCFVFLFRCANDAEISDVKIVAVDLQAMAPLPGVIQLQGDITKVSCFLIGTCDTGHDQSAAPVHFQLHRDVQHMSGNNVLNMT